MKEISLYTIAVLQHPPNYSYFYTMSFPSLTYGVGFPTSTDDADQIVQLLKSHGVERLDTARIYVRLSPFSGGYYSL